MSDLERVIAAMAKSLEKPHQSAQDGDKRVVYRSVDDWAQAIRMMRELSQPSKTRIVLRARRPKL